MSANLISAAISYYSAGSDRGWWPVLLLVLAIVALIYSCLFSAVASFNHWKLFPSACIHILLALTSVLLTVMFYHIDIDWLAVNDGAELSMVEKIISSDFTVYIIHVVALVVAMTVGWIGSFRRIG